MSVVLNKIDPVIINSVHQQTAEEVVHTSKKVKVSKDKEKKKDRESSYDGMKEKLQKFNSILELMDIDLSLLLDDDCVSAVGKDGKVFKRYTKEALIELLNKMEYMIGVFLDTKI